VHRSALLLYRTAPICKANAFIPKRALACKSFLRIIETFQSALRAADILHIFKQPSISFNEIIWKGFASYINISIVKSSRQY